MTDYSELVKQLREYANEYEHGTPTGDTSDDAAAAIEALQAEVADKDYLIQQQADEIERLRLDVKKQQEKMIELAKKLPKRGERTINPYENTWAIENGYI